MLVPPRWIPTDSRVNDTLARYPRGAESEAAAESWVGSLGGEPAPLGEFSLTLGHTGSHRPVENTVPDNVPVVLVPAARGPE